MQTQLTNGAITAAGAAVEVMADESDRSLTPREAAEFLGFGTGAMKQWRLKNIGPPYWKFRFKPKASPRGSKVRFASDRARIAATQLSTTLRTSPPQTSSCRGWSAKRCTTR